MSNEIPEGWYPDPDNQLRERYWDGSQWAEGPGRLRPETTVPIPALASATEPLPWWKRRWVQVTAGVLAFLFVFGALFGEDESKEKATDNTPAPVPTVTVTEPAGTNEAKPLKAPPSKEAKKREAPAKQDTPAPDADSWTMPDEVGQNLQAAQDHIQGVTGDPFFFTDSEDATGQARFQVLDANWLVCGQTPAASSTFDYNTDIIFYVVQDGEDCP